MERSTSLAMLGVLVYAWLAFPQLASGDDDEPSVTNVRFEPSGDQVVISYDLGGPSTAHFRISITLLRESDKSFSRELEKTSGDVGRGIVPGPGKRVVWNLRTEYPDGLPGNDFYFEVNAEPMASASATSPLLWIGAGLVVAGGVTTYFLLEHHPQSQPLRPEPAFPPPPGRP